MVTASITGSRNQAEPRETHDPLQVHEYSAVFDLSQNFNVKYNVWHQLKGNQIKTPLFCRNTCFVSNFENAHISTTASKSCPKPLKSWLSEKGKEQTALGI